MTSRLRTAAIAGALALLGSTVLAQDPPAKPTPPSPPSQGGERAEAKPIEFAEMFWAIASGAMMDGTGGWFHPSETRYGWEWLAGRFDADKDGKVSRQELKCPPELFVRLDRNKDQNVTADDLDWSSRSAFARAAMPSNQWFRMFDGNSNGKISAEEWQALFNRASKG